ncbi:hypothetical protein ABZ734_01355 [Streptomyces sp. NPDC006660]|uniref:hypothetical protein n=1 Tax=Streptomyces sp. NPDC006660 TaxID=3156901 RepID=UPI0033ECC743
MALAVHAVTAVLAVGGALLVVLGRPRYLLCAFGAILSTAAVAPWPRWPSTS